MIHSILFLLPVSGGGGAHSIMQEAAAMCRLGVNALVAGDEATARALREKYVDLAMPAANIVAFGTAEELRALIERHKPDWTIATANSTISLLADALPPDGGHQLAYYVQDYEPLFYDPDSEDWHRAHASYELIPGITLLAKTRWLQEVVENNHSVSVSKISPSVDHGIFYPNVSALNDRDLLIAAMVRPSTPRRAPRRTLRILETLSLRWGERVNLQIFGASDEELRANGLAVPASVSNLGVLSREEVGELFRRTSLFLDLSDYQAFGRTAIEAMSCGVLVIAPAHGGASEFTRDGVNSFVVDTRSDEAILRAANAVIAMERREALGIRWAAVHAGYRFFPETAAISILDVLRDRASP